MATARLLGTALFVLLTACLTDKEVAELEQAESGMYVDANSDAGAALLQKVDGTCDTSCTWVADSDGTIGQIELYLSETGDTTSEHFWEEYHDAFAYVGPSVYGGDEFQIDLAIVGSYMDQVSNISTIFDVNDAIISNQLTVMFIMYDDSADYADCCVYGDDPSYFSSDCTNNWDD